MSPTAKPTRSYLPNEIARHIDLLQKGFRKIGLPSNSTDLARHAERLLRQLYRKSVVDLLHQTPETGGWQLLADGKARGFEQIHEVLGRKKLSSFVLQETSIGLCAVWAVGNASGLAVALKAARGRLKCVERDIILLRLFANLFETAYQNIFHRRNEKALVFSLNHRVLQLNSLIDTGIEITKLDQGASLQHLALERAASLTNASKGVVRVTEKERLVEESYFPDRLQFQGSTDERQTITTTFSFANKTYTFELFEKESRQGIVPFEDTDQMLLDALARQVHASLENRYLLQKALENQRFEQDMAVAASIQKRIIPAKLPELQGYDVAGINIPSKSVGGDYYDCIPLLNGAYALVIADVAGKGVPAALLVSSLHAYLSAYLEGTMPLSELAQRLNKVIWRASTDDKFITAFVGILSPATGELEMLNAGHNPTYLLRNDGSVQEFGAAGLPLGMLEIDFPYQSERVTIERGERLFLYTDGITEAANDQQAFYDNLRPLKDFFQKHSPASSGQFISELIADIKTFTGSAPQSDDITALYLRRLP